MEYYAAERKKELLPFATAWMELESIMLSEISQAVKDKYHMILLPGDYSVPLSPWILCQMPGNWNYGSQCQSLVKRKGSIYSKVIDLE